MRLASFPKVMQHSCLVSLVATTNYLAER